MIVPQYWAEARLQQRTKGKQVTVRRFGWSDDSVAAAQTHADARVRDAFDRIIAGEPLVRREHRLAYNGAEGLPIREEVVARDGDCVITRNGYGALCLNTPDVLFADIDFEDAPGGTLVKRLLMATFVMAVAMALWRESFGWGLVSVIAGLVLTYPLAKALHGLRVRLAGGHEARAKRRLASFIAGNPAWGLRLYRTPAGLRVLATHATFGPRDAAVTRFFEAVAVDQVYARMCQLQNCFRARLSPKPWRVGLARHIKPRYAVWEASHADLAERRQWIDDYEHASRGHAACRFVEALGAGDVDAKVAPVLALHDAHCRATQTLPLA